MPVGFALEARILMQGRIATDVMYGGEFMSREVVLVPVPVLVLVLHVG